MVTFFDLDIFNLIIFNLLCVFYGDYTITRNDTQEKKEKFESSYPKGVRIAAIIGVIFLVALYIVTLIAGITTSKAAPELFKMCIGSSILLPILFWLYIQFAKSFMNRDRENIKKEK